MRISDWSSDVCSSDLLVIVPISRFIDVVGQDQRGITALRRHFRLDDQRLIGPKLIRAFIIELSEQAAEIRHHVENLELVDIAFLTKLDDMVDQEGRAVLDSRSAEHTSELPSLMRISYAVYCLKHQIIPKTQ